MGGEKEQIRHMPKRLLKFGNVSGRMYFCVWCFTHTYYISYTGIGSFIWKPAIQRALNYRKAIFYRLNLNQIINFFSCNIIQYLVLDPNQARIGNLANARGYCKTVTIYWAGGGAVWAPTIPLVLEC